PSLQVFADVAHASYLALRGEHVAAIAAYDQIYAGLRELDADTAWPAFRACFACAHALNALGDHARAKQLVTEILARAGADEVSRVVAHYLEPQRQLALAEAGLGNHAQAIELLDGLLRAHGHEQQPMLIGLLHKARAEVALSMQDQVAFVRHFTEMERCFRAAKNPALIAQIEQLAQRAVRAGNRPPEAASYGEPLSSLVSVSESTQRSLSDARDPRERCELALQLILSAARARSGYLYMLKGGQLQLAAQSSHGAPPPRYEQHLRSEIERARQALTEDEATVAVDAADPSTADDAPSVFIDSVVSEAASESDPAASGERHRVLVLSMRREDEVVVVGGVIAAFDSPESGFAVSIELLEPIASALYESATDSSAAEL
ncbi:MAG TPA: hypothetical protein VK509_10465, partial [Polyangiales bacterium]|nr:hypothetical protein [Polyangiales bacterium]